MPASGLPRVPRLTRRSLLGAALGTTLLTAGCTLGEDEPAAGARPGPRPEVDPDVAVAAAALGHQERMLELLRSTGERHGGLAAQLDAAASAHRQHAAMLRDAVPDGVATGAPSSTSSGRGPSPGSSPSPTPTAVPRRPRSALESVVTAEEELGAAMKQHAFRAESGAFARVLGSMAASSTQHAFVLRSALSRRGARGGDR